MNSSTLSFLKENSGTLLLTAFCLILLVSLSLYVGASLHGPTGKSAQSQAQRESGV